jgi:hypothetical protein
LEKKIRADKAISADGESANNDTADGRQPMSVARLVSGAFVNVVDGVLDVFVHLIVFVLASVANRGVDFVDGCVAHASVIPTLLKMMPGGFEVPDGTFDVPVFSGPFGVFELRQRILIVARVSLADAEDGCQCKHAKERSCRAAKSGIHISRMV